jgi:polar amino acid transport system substrate-binding protein
VKRSKFAILEILVVLMLVGSTCRRTPSPAESPSFTTLREGVLTVGSNIPFRPFEFEEDGELTGFDVELVAEIASRLDLEPTWVDTRFRTMFTELASSRFDLVASATTITADREKTVDFSDHYYNSRQSLVVNMEETPNLESTDDLKAGDVVAVQQTTTSELWANENLEPRGVKVRSFVEALDPYTALEAGHVTGVIFDEPSAVEEAKKRPQLEVVEIIDTGEKYGFAFNSDNDALRDSVNRVLREMITDGTYAEIFGRYFPSVNVPPEFQQEG